MNSLSKMNAKLDLMSFRLIYIDRGKTIKPDTRTNCGQFILTEGKVMVRNIVP